MKEAGHDIRTLFLCGGLSKNALFVQIHANATGIQYQHGDISLYYYITYLMFFQYYPISGLPVVLPNQMEAVLIGAAVLGACASQDYSSIQVE